MRRSLLGILAVLTMAAATAHGSAPAPVAQRFKTMSQLMQNYDASWDLELPPAGQDPEERIRWVTRERDALGRTPMGWVDWVNETFTADLPAATEPQRADPAVAGIVGSVGSLYAALGLPYDAVAVRAQAEGLSPRVRGAFADLLDIVAGIYPQQSVIAASVLARLSDGFDEHEVLVTRAERDAMALNQTRIVDAVNMFRARTVDAFPAATPATASVPLFQDPEGLVVLGSTGADTYVRSGAILDPILLVDPAGDDTYANSAGGACPVTVGGVVGGKWMECNGLALSVVADIGDGVTVSSNDVYVYDGLPAPIQGAGGPGGLGVLIDVGGNDSYSMKMTRTTSNPFFQYLDGGGQGFGYGGSGLLLDASGDDTYRFDIYSTQGRGIWALGQGFGGAGGLGIAHDVSGSDRWTSYTLGTATGSGDFQGIYTGGGGFYGGVGIASDTGLSDDVWYSNAVAPSTDYYAQGFGAFGGVGILYEDGGNDTYTAREEATSSSPQINPVLNCAFGTASFGGVGVMIDVAGDDTYVGETVSKRGAYTMDFGFGGPGVAYGVFLDVTGADSYTMIATAPSTKLIDGYGYYRAAVGGDLLNWPLGHTTFGAFADTAGTDKYTHVPSTAGGRGRNNDQWPFGVDRGV